jgi:hypothetical protein
LKKSIRSSKRVHIITSFIIVIKHTSAFLNFNMVPLFYCLLATFLNAYTIHSFHANRCRPISSKRVLNMGYEVKDLKSLTVKEMLNAVSGTDLHYFLPITVSANGI